MSCFHPLTAYWATPYGSGITFVKEKTIYTTNPIKLPCGQCSGCKLENARQWAIRIKHEASMHANNTFITLTYDNEHLPPTGTLVLKHWQDFMKRLRKKYSHKKLSFYHCGEYGEKQGRPHYHAIIFNHQFSDLIPIPRKKDLHTSKTLDQLWGKGFTSVGSVTFESASYVASYVQKKINGPKAEAINMSNGLRHYERMTAEGEVITLKKEYATMSRNPGIAALWLTKHHTDIYPSDFVTHKGKKHALPKFYDRQYEMLINSTGHNPEIMETIKQKRQYKMESLKHLFTPEALKQKEVHHKAKMALYKRNTL
jgi:hypothetical protein